MIIRALGFGNGYIRPVFQGLDNRLVLRLDRYFIIYRNNNFQIDSLSGHRCKLLPRRWRVREKMARLDRTMLDLKVAGRMWQSMTLDSWV